MKKSKEIHTYLPPKLTFFCSYLFFARSSFPDIALGVFAIVTIRGQRSELSGRDSTPSSPIQDNDHPTKIDYPKPTNSKLVILVDQASRDRREILRHYITHTPNKQSYTSPCFPILPLVLTSHPPSPIRSGRVPISYASWIHIQPQLQLHSRLFSPARKEMMPSFSYKLQ